MIRTQLVLLTLLFGAVEVSAQILRPPTIDTCAECPPLNSFYCNLYPVACTQCWLECGAQPGEPPRRVRPIGPPFDPYLGDYSLPSILAVTQVHHEDVPWTNPALRHMDNLELANEVWLHGFSGLKVWIQEGPMNGSDFSWQTLRGEQMFTPDSDGWGEDMLRFWREVPQEVLFVRPAWYAWTGQEDTERVRVTTMDADFYAIAKRLYQEIGYRDIVIVLTDWEQDWLYETFPDWTLWQIERRQADVERARREAFLELGYRPNLRVMHSVILNRYPANGGEEGKTLAEQIQKLNRKPDLIGLSYWQNGIDPRPTLDWVLRATGYTKQRIYIDEIGADEWNQEQRFLNYIPLLREWGLHNPICIWLWKQTWCDPDHQRGLWQQAQPCQGKPVFTDPTAGYYVLQDIMEER